MRQCRSTSIWRFMTRRNNAIVRPVSMRLSGRTSASRGSRSTRRIASTAKPATSRIRRRTSTGSFPKAAEARIIRTCNLAALISGVMLLAGPAAAVRSDEVSPFARYVRARAADAAGMSDLAAMQYAAALDEAPDNLALALRTYRQAAVAGDRQLALKTA